MKQLRYSFGIILFTLLVTLPFHGEAACFSPGGTEISDIFHGKDIGVGVYEKSDDHTFELFVGNEFVPFKLTQEALGWCDLSSSSPDTYFIYLSSKDGETQYQYLNVVEEKERALAKYTEYENMIEGLASGNTDIRFSEEVLYRAPDHTLRPGMEGPEVEELQRALRVKLELGDDFKIDGKYGPATANAVKRFQQIIGIQQDGVAGPKTLARLNGVVIGVQTKSLSERKNEGGEVSVPTVSIHLLGQRALRVGSGGEDVRELQKLLKRILSLGDDFKIDGKYGPATANAVRLVQGKAGIQVDGIAGKQTKQAIIQLLSASQGNQRGGGESTEQAPESTQEGSIGNGGAEEQTVEVQDDETLIRSLKALLLRAKSALLKFKRGRGNKYNDTAAYEEVIRYNGELLKAYSQSDPLYVSTEGGENFLYTVKVPTGEYLCVDGNADRELVSLPVRPDPAVTLSCPRSMVVKGKSTE